MAFFNNLFNRVSSGRDAPALPQMGVLPQVTPVKQLTGIGAIPNTNVPMQTITLPSGQTVQIPQLNMEEINANLLAAGITPQTPLPNIIPEVATPTPSLPVATPSLPVAPPSLPVAPPSLPVAAPAVQSIDPFASVERTPSADLDFFQTTPVLPTPEELRRQAADESAERISGSTNQTTNPELFNPDGTPKMIEMGTGFPGGPSLDFEFPPAPAVATPPVATPPVATPPVATPAATTPAVEQPLAPYTGAGYDAFGEQPFVSGVIRDETGLDALSKQLLFGLDGQGGFIPGAMQAAETTFFNPDGTPRVVEEQRAGFTGDQTAGMDLARSNVGIQDRFLSGAEGAFQQGVSDIGQGIERGRGFQQQGLQALQSGIGGLQGELGGVEGIARGAAGNFGTQLGGIAGRGIGATDRFGRRIGESEGLLRGTTGAYDQGLTSQFYNPYEDRVVQQTIDDVFEAGEKQDMAARARDIQTGGESAFGSRARLSAGERREALGRGLGEALGGIRSRGFSEAQQTGLGEFARQRQAERLASSGLAGLSGQRLGAQQALGSQLTGLAGAQLGAQQNLGSTLTGLAGTRFGAAQTGAGALSNMGALETQYGQNLANAQFGLGSNLQNLGSARQQAGAFDVNQLMSSGALQQAQDQSVIDAQRRNQLQAQQAPLAQYQALAPFVSMAPAGTFQTRTQFAPKPSALQAGLATGLGAFGAIGNFMNQGKG